MRYAQLSNNTVLQVIESEIDPDGTNGEWIECGNAGPGWTTTDKVTFTPPVIVLPEWYWFLDIGPFTDRFGAKKSLVENSTDPVAQGFDKDLSRRKWVNLKDSRTIGAISYLAGMTIPGIGTIAAPIFTAGEAAAILNTVPTPEENLALRKVYFGG